MTLTKILIGDDQIGQVSDVNSQRMRRDFELDYKALLTKVDITYTANPNQFIEMAKTKQYAVLMIDLNWEKEDANREYKTGYQVLDAVVDCAPKRVLWTSENKEAREKGYQHGATHCISKRPIPEEMEKLWLE